MRLILTLDYLFLSHSKLKEALNYWHCWEGGYWGVASKDVR